MPRSLRLLLSLFVLAVNVAPALAQAEEEAAVRAAVDHYLQGHATGEAAHFRAAFHPVANLYWVAGDTLAQRTGEAYIAGARGTPPPDEARRRRWISDVDIAGTAAVARVVLDYPNAVFTDYLSLLKVNGEWKVVNKIFHVEPKQP